MSRSRLICGGVFAIALLLGLASLVVADDPVEPSERPSKANGKETDGAPDKPGKKSDEKTAAPLRFRRIFAPADRVQDWPRGRARYVPVDGEEFERLIKAAGDQPGGVSGVLAATLVRAEYTAEFDGVDTLSGSARCAIRHTTRSQTLMPLAPFGFALRRAWWHSETNPEARQPAKLGSDAGGKLGLLVDENGEFEFEWSLRGERNSDGRLSFALQFPRCAASEIQLSMPRGLLATVSDGLIVPMVEGTPRVTGGLPFVPKPAAGAPRETVRILLGGKQTAVLRLTPPGANAAAQPRAVLRETVVYDVSPRGLDVTATWKLDVQGPPLRQMRVTLDPGLQLVSTRLGEIDVPWSAGPRVEGEPTTLFLTLPEPLSGADRSLRLAAIGPLELEKTCGLPRLRAVDAFWQEGTHTLLVREPLILTSLTTTDCRQTKYSLLPEPNRGEAFDVQLFSPTADVRLTFARKQRLPELVTGATIEIGPDEARAVLGVTAEAAGDMPTSLAAEILPGWTIDAVESRPADALTDWGVTTSASGGSLSMRFSQSHDAEGPPVIFVRSHARARDPATAGEKRRFRAEDLVPLRFRDAQLGESLLTLRPQQGYDVRVVEAQNLARLDFSRLTSEQASLFSAPAPAAVYQYDSRRSHFTAFAQSQRPRYGAEVQSEAVVAGETLTESYKLRVAPDGARVSKLLVHFSPAREEPLRWRMNSEVSSGMVARRLSDAERTASDAPLAAEAWELTLNAPRSAPVEIFAMRSSPLAGSARLSLATLPDATNGQGRLTIKGAADELFTLSNQGLKPAEAIDAPDEGGVADTSSRLRACFEYGAGSEAGGVTVARTTAGLATANAIVWRREIQSWEDGAGRGAHVATFYIQNAGRPEVVLSADPALKIERLWRDGMSLAVSRESAIKIQLPTDQELVTLVVELASAGSSPGMLADIELPDIAIDLPILQTEWALRLPPGYELLNIAGGSCDQAPGELSWSQRLFGPLGRASRVSPLDPLSMENPIDDDPPTQSERATAKHSIDRWPRPGVSSTIRDVAGDAALIIRVDGNQAVAHLARRSSLATLAVAIFTLALAAGLYAVGAARRFALMFLFVAAAIALTVPSYYASLATGGLWGISLALLWQWARRALPQPQPRRREAPSNAGSVSAARRASLARQALPVLLAVGWFAIADPLALAQPAPPAESDTGPVVYRVFIPVDEEERPTKDKYQVPQELHDELRRRAGDLAGASQGYLIESARYQLAVNREAASDALVAGDVLAHYEVQVLQPEAPVRLPLTGVRPGPLARRDGSVIEFAWEIDEDGILCHFDEPGTYQLEFMLRPARGDLGPAGLDIGIPRVARSTLEVQLPTDPPAIDVPIALGAIKVASEGRKVSAELGPVDRLSVVWNKPRAARGAPTTDVDAWLWMQVQPGSVILHAHLDVKPLRTAPLKELRLSVDPRLRPLPLGEAPGVVAAVEALPMDPRTIRVELSRAIQEPTTLRLSFLVTGSSGVGQLQLPQLAPEGGKFSQRVLAVSVDPALEYEASKVEGETALAIPEFLAHWGEASTAPQLATRLPADPLWSMNTRPREARDAARQTLFVSVDETQAQIRYEAQLFHAEERSTSGGFTCRRRLRVPTEMQVENVSLLQNGIERVSRFSRDAAGDLTVFLASPVAGRQHLTLNGWAPIAPSGRLSLPRIELLSVDRLETVVMIYRQPAVHIAVEALQSLAAVPLPPAPLPLGVAESPIPGRVVAAFATQSDDYGGTLVVTRNRPRVVSTQLSSISQESGGWQGRMEYRCAVSDGSLDAIHFKLPAEWTGPFEMTPATAIATIETQGDERRLVVRPKSAVDGEYRVMVRGPLRASFGERFTFPTLIAATNEESNAFVLLPVNARNQHVAWQVLGLRPERLPDDVGPSALVEAHESYRLLEPTAAARLLRRGAPGGETRITHNEVQLCWSDDAPARGVIRCEVQPVGQAECILHVPEQTKILELRVAGLVVTASPAAQGWRVPLDSSAATQAVEVAFVGPPVAKSMLGEIELNAPWIAGPKVERTSWTVFAPNAAGVGELVGVDAQLPPIETPPTGLQSQARFGCGRSDHWNIAGEASSLRLRYRHARPLANFERWFCALALATVGMAVAFVRQPLAGRIEMAQARFDWRPWAGLALGLAAWVWISPAWIGMVVVVASLMAWGWQAVRMARAAPKDSDSARVRAG